MKKHVGGLSAYLNAVTQEKINPVPALETKAENQEVVLRLDARDIQVNPLNHYGMREIEELAGRIHVSGLIEPGLVKKMDDGQYMLISGARRRQAILLLWERGEMVRPMFPCIEYTPRSRGVLTAADIEILSLMYANKQREYYTVDERINEMDRSEPIARKMYSDMVAMGKIPKGLKFRQYFAENFLYISESAVQRLRSLKNLEPEVRQAITDQRITETAALELGGLDAENQLAYLAALAAGEADGSIKDIQARKRKIEWQKNNKGSSDIEPMEQPADIEQLADIENSTNEDDPLPPKAAPSTLEPSLAALEADGQQRLIEEENQQVDQKPAAVASADSHSHDSKSLASMDASAEHDAVQWIMGTLESMLAQAETMIASHTAAGKEKEAAIWDVRRAKAKLVIAMLKNAE